MKRILMVCMTLAVMSNTYAAAPVNWKEATPTAVSVFGEADIQTRQCRLMELDLAALTDYLRRAPAESELLPGLVLEIPMPDGGSARYSVKSVPVVHPDMQKKYPGIYTWAGQGVDDPA
ncbi:MAG: hypothetical protein JNL88_00355, partial [Bacteroidia bacterium]|nr:hypothetical protein [Bacteroidia bacterium]